jgi:hypothetical protein
VHVDTLDAVRPRLQHLFDFEAERLQHDIHTQKGRENTHERNIVEIKTSGAVQTPERRRKTLSVQLDKLALKLAGKNK